MVELSFREFLKRYNGLYKESDRIYHNLARHYGLSDCAFWILYTIREEDRPLTQTELCGALFTTKQTVNSALKNLERAGYIDLVSIPANRRNKEIQLTDAGMSFVKQTIDMVFNIEKNAFLRLTEKERVNILTLGRRHLDALRMEAGEVLTKGLKIEDDDAN